VTYSDVLSLSNFEGWGQPWEGRNITTPLRWFIGGPMQPFQVALLAELAAPVSASTVNGTTDDLISYLQEDDTVVLALVGWGSEGAMDYTRDGEAASIGGINAHWMVLAAYDPTK